MCVFIKVRNLSFLLTLFSTFTENIWHPFSSRSGVSAEAACAGSDGSKYTVLRHTRKITKINGCKQSADVQDSFMTIRPRIFGSGPLHGQAYLFTGSLRSTEKESGKHRYSISMSEQRRMRSNLVVLSKHY